MRITTDTTARIGAGQCVLAEPRVFDQDDDGAVVLLTEHPDRDCEPGVREAVTLCPARALSTTDD